MSDADYAEGLARLKQGDAANAAALFARAAARGHAPARLAYARALAEGLVDYEPEAAFAQLELGYRAGDARCGLSLASFYARGFGCAQSWGETAAILCQMASRGVPAAARELAMLMLLAGRADLAGPCLGAAARVADGPVDVIALALARPNLGADLARADDVLAQARAPIAHLNNRQSFSPQMLAAPPGWGEAGAIASAMTFAPPAFASLSDDPAIAIAPGAVAPLLCDYVLLSAWPFLRAATVYDPTTGEEQRDPVRTGATAAFEVMRETPGLAAIRAWLCACVGADAARGESLSVISYEPGQEYRPHFDSFAAGAGAGEKGDAAGGPRTHTVLINLNEGFEGGETMFPRLNLSIAPGLGQIIRFANTEPAGAPHPKSLHQGRKVARGRKFIASQWVRERVFRER